MLDSATWEVLDRMVQWVIIPVIAWVWATNKRVDELEKINVKLSTLLDARNEQHRIERAMDTAQIRRLTEVLDRIEAKLENVEIRK